MSGSNLAVRLDRAIDRAASWFRGVRCLDGTFKVGETPAFFDVPPFCRAIGEGVFAQHYIDRVFQESQPDSENRYLWRWNSDGRPLLDYPEKDALDCVMVRGAPRQGYWKSGLLISCLTLLHADTGTPEYLQTACAHFQRAVQNADDVTHTAYSHKLAWASALLYRVTGISRHRRIAVEIAEHLMSLQRKDGSFVYPEAQRPEKGPNPWEMSTTFQFATWLHTVRSIL